MQLGDPWHEEYLQEEDILVSNTYVLPLLYFPPEGDGRNSWGLHCQNISTFGNSTEHLDTGTQPKIP